MPSPHRLRRRGPLRTSPPGGPSDSEDPPVGSSLTSPNTNVVVVGQGYVGLPLALAAATAGYDVTGVDLDDALVEALNAGRSPIRDISDGEIGTALARGHYRADRNYESVRTAGTVVICVPTPWHDDAPDLSHIEAAATEVGARLGTGALVILESTTYPGTTLEVLQPILEKASGLRGAVDFDVAFSPERIDPGNQTYTIRNTPKVVGGTTPLATERACAFYSRFVDQVVPVSSPSAAEMTKLLENTFRHINVALVNELAILCRELGIDVWEVVDAAASKPFGFMRFEPGPGVGGHCIPVDPMYLSWRVRQLGRSAKFIELARDINVSMPVYCATRIQDLLNDLGRPVRGARILVVGAAYKPGVPDTRESPALPLIDALLAKGAAVAYHDPLVPWIEVHESRMGSVDLRSYLSEPVDCAAIITPQPGVDYEAIIAASSAVFDARNVLRSGSPKVYVL